MQEIRVLRSPVIEIDRTGYSTIIEPQFYVHLNKRDHSSPNRRMILTPSGVSCNLVVKN